MHTLIYTDVMHSSRLCTSHLLVTLYPVEWAVLVIICMLTSAFAILLFITVTSPFF